VSSLKEKYYAVRIGKVPLNTPYFMLGPNGKTPELFATLKEAQEKCPKEKGTKVVRIYITTQ
jgi:hypothetical protein